MFEQVIVIAAVLAFVGAVVSIRLRARTAQDDA